MHNAADLRERGFQLLSAPVTFVAFDPAGDGADRDALVAVSREEHQRGEPHDPDFAVEFVYRVLMAHRLPADWEFPDKLAALLSFDRQLKTWTNNGRQAAHFICIETNGVGYGYASSLARKTETKVIPYITVGHANAVRAKQEDAQISMPRLKALDNLRILIETGYLRRVKNAPGADMLDAEMNAFVWRGKNRPEAMTGQHDDLVMALTGSVWIASNIVPPILKQQKSRNAAPKPVFQRMRMN